MVFDAVMTNYPSFYGLPLMTFSLLSHPGSSFVIFTPLDIAKEYEIVEIEWRKDCAPL